MCDSNEQTPIIGPDLAQSSPAPQSPDGVGRQGADPRTLELLVCPLTKAVLEYDSVRQELISRRANLAYPIRSGVPLLTREAARNLDEGVRSEPSRGRPGSKSRA
jgi:uncharacterized protein